MSQPHSLRPHQASALDQAHALVSQGARRILLVAPTGTGKTVMGATIVREAVAAGGTALWMSHRRELVAQAAHRLASEGLFVGALAAVRVETVQGLLAKSERPPADVIIADEAHHFVSDEWRKLALDYPKALIVGLTATPERADGRPMGDAFDHLVEVSSVRRLTEEGYLVPCHVYGPRGPQTTMAESPIAAYQRLTPGKKAVFFGRDVAHARALADALHTAGVPAECIDGELPADERVRRLAAYRAGELTALTNVHILTEGWDAPETEVCVLARAMGAAGTYLQCIGRALRPSPGKSHATVIDLCGSVFLHGLPDEERTYSLEGRAPIARTRRMGLSTCEACGATYPSAPQCPRCGFAAPAKPAPRVVRGSVDRVEATATRAERAAHLAQLRAVARRRSLPEAWVRAKYFQRWKRAAEAELSDVA